MRIMDSQNIKETVRQIFTEYLNLHRHRKTPERYAILDAIYSFDSHFDMDTLYTRMAEEEKFRVSRATLYNTILLLLDAHLVVKHQFGGSSQYERCYLSHTHHHICTQCGKVEEVQDDVLRELIEQSKLKQFTLSHYSLYLYGLCAKCNRVNKRKLKDNIKKKEK